MDKPISYKGSEPYIFVSYAHKDSDAVWPIIARMQGGGYRVWYDDGIDPGTEWDENIANHVEGCGYFIAFLSEGYLASDNCRDELNFARDLGKERLLVYLSDVALPAGMRMRLNRLQAIHWYTYENSAKAFSKLYESQGLGACRGKLSGRSPSPKSTANLTSGTESSLKFDVILTDFSLSAKIKCIKVIREITGQGLAEAKDTIEHLPAVIKIDVSRAEAESLKASLEEAGGIVRLSSSARRNIL